MPGRVVVVPGRMVVVPGRMVGAREDGMYHGGRELYQGGQQNWPKLWDKIQNGKPRFNAEVGRCCTSTVFCTLALFPDSMQQLSFAGNETNLT